MSISIIKKNPLAISIQFNDEKVIIFLKDGRELAVPLEWFPRLRDAMPAQLNNWRFIGEGEGIHWPDLDEDISIENLLE